MKNMSNINKNEFLVKNEYSVSNKIFTCNYSKKPGHIEKDFWKSKFNNEIKARNIEGSSAASEIKTLGDMKDNSDINDKNR